MNALEKFFTKKRVIILAVLWIITNVFLNFGPWSISALAEVSGGMGIPDLMMNYDLDKLRILFTAYGPKGIAIYKNIQLIDFIYPLIYGALLLGLLVRLKLKPSFRVLYATPFLIVILDYAENLIIRHLINLYPNLPETQSHLANLANLCTLQKWSGVGMVIFAIIGFWIWNRFKKEEKLS